MTATVKKAPGERALFVSRLPPQQSRKLAVHLEREGVRVEECANVLPATMPKWATVLLVHCDSALSITHAKRVADDGRCRFGVVHTDWSRTRENLRRAGLLPAQPPLSVVFDADDDSNTNEEESEAMPVSAPSAKKAITPEELREFLRGNALTPELRAVVLEEGTRLERRAKVDRALEALEPLDDDALLLFASSLSAKLRANLHAACAAAGVER